VASGSVRAALARTWTRLPALVRGPVLGLIGADWSWRAGVWGMASLAAALAAVPAFMRLAASTRRA
jgi:hypothetical protein